MQEKNTTPAVCTVALSIDSNGGCDMAFTGSAGLIVAALEMAMASVLLRVQYPAGCTAESYAESIPAAIVRRMNEIKKQEEAAQCQQNGTMPVQ